MNTYSCKNDDDDDEHPMGGQACDQVPTRIATHRRHPHNIHLCSATFNLPPFCATGRDCSKLKSKAPGMIPDLKFMHMQKRESGKV